MRTLMLAALGALGIGLPALSAGGQSVGPQSFKALPRRINYAMPLVPAGGPPAVIVRGRLAPWTREAALAVQAAIQEWAGVKLEVTDDRAATSEETWLPTDAHRRTPLIVLGNARDNRVMHALGTRYLLQSNRTWPGGDRYILRTVFEPFVADVNYLVLEASTGAGMDGALAKFRELLKGVPRTETATIPLTRVVGSVKDKWEVEPRYWKAPPEWTPVLDRSVSELAAAYKGEVVPAGDDFAKAGLVGEIFWHTVGGIAERPGNPPTVTLDAGTLRAMAAMYLLGCRKVGGRTHQPSDHYGAMRSVRGIRCLFQGGVLTPEVLNEFESCLVLSGAHPNEYFYEHIGSDSGFTDLTGGRHSMACLLVSVHTLDYVLNHCQMDDQTRKEIGRRAEGARKATARYVRSFRNNIETSCLGEDTLLQFYAVLHQGLLENVRNGNLRRSADFYMLTTDNVFVPGQWPFCGCYAGLAGFSSGPGGITTAMVGRGLVDAVAFYYDDPQYRWLATNWTGPRWSVATDVLTMHVDSQGEMVKPTMYDGVRALPYDERMYRVAADREMQRRWQFECRLPPEPPEKAVDRVAFRDGLDPKGAYLFLATSQDLSQTYPAQNNAIARYTDLGEIWLYHNTTRNSTWSRNVVSISNGESYVPRAACLLEALANLGEVSAVAVREQGVGGCDWTRTIVHWRGHYFAVLDRMEALGDDDFSFVCRWRALRPALFKDGVWTAAAPSGSTMRIQNTEALFQTAEHWECDGSARPYVLQQFKQAKLAKGQSATYQNLLFVSGAERPDRFEARQVDANALLVNGQTAAGSHLALIGAGGGIALPGLETDAAIYDVMGNRLHLAGVTTLKARIGGTFQGILWAERPVNALVDCEAGRGEIEVTGGRPVRVRSGTRPGPEVLAAGRHAVTLADAGALPTPAPQLDALWRRSRPAPSIPPAGVGGDQPGFEVIAGSAPLQQPLARLSRFAVSSTPPPTEHGGRRIWSDCADLVITLTFPEPTAVSCLRLVTITKMVPMYGLGSQGYGEKRYESRDFRFSLALSDDDFQRDVRTIEAPETTFEETPSVSVGHGTMFRLPTWCLTVGARARQVKVLPRATTKERATLYLTDLEAYGADRVGELSAQAVAADVNGDGSNELVVGTSEKELAAYDADGKRLWHKTYSPGDIYTMGTADLDDDGKAEILVYLTSEELHRVNGDGSERAIADIHRAQLEAFDQRAAFGSVTTLGTWAPSGVKNKEVVMWAEPLFRVLPDGTVKVESGKIGHPQGVGRLANLFPNEPEVLATVNRYGLTLWSPRRDERDNYVRLGSKPVAGTDSGESRGLGWVQPVNLPAFKGLLTAIEGGLNWYPISTFLPDSKEEGWAFGTGGVPAVAALAEDFTGDGVSEMLLARQDGFVNVFALKDGALVGLLKTGERILGMAVVRDRENRPCLAVGTQLSVHLFGADLRLRGRQALPAVAFAGPGGQKRDRVYVVDATGKVTVLKCR